MYEQVKGKYGTLDSITNEHVIMGLSVTDKWEICKDILNEIKLTCVPNSIAYSCTVKAAFQNGQFDYAWNLLNEMLEKNRKPNNMCYIAYIDKCIEDKSISLEKLFEFLGDNDLICDWELIQNLRKYFQETKFVKITQKGLCTGCKKVIPRIDLSDEEFDVLKSKIFERVIVGKDVFRNTSPSELQLFQKMMNKNINYDVVIDGLNVAYSAGTKTSAFVNAHLLSSVVRYYIEQNKKVLVLGRTHMERWPKKYFDFIRANAEIFLTQNISKDDPYLLYCALHAGSNAIIVSRDLMRSHVYLLKENHHKRLFTRWLTQSQHQLVKVLDNGDVIIKKPLPYVETTQKVDGYWHLPYYTVENQESVNWMCLKLK
ncbi:PREDICTED: mitochondrial ribonuclease P protein 3 isoform X2 [Nicrophorus vespilloides]|nr:PREDICTED: mitochondrial ribonuclease P protein 3 isoform X2 [Nicrophorus vespilloides]